MTKATIRSKKLVIIILIILGIAVFAIAGYFLSTHLVTPSVKDVLQEKPLNYKQETQDAQTTSDVGQLVDKHASTVDQASKDTFGGDVRNWSDMDVDKAYYALVYAAKTGNFTEVININSLLETAQNSGKNVSGERVGVSDAQRQRYVSDARRARDGQ